MKAINEIPSPSDKQGVQRILAIANYAQKFAPNLADLAKPLWELVKKENESVWEEDVHVKCLEKVTQVLTQAPVLKFFNPQKKTVLQCDTSMSGLGAYLLQDGHPVVYESRTLTPTELTMLRLRKNSYLLSLEFSGLQSMVDTYHNLLESII